MYTSKIGSIEFEMLVDRFVTSLKRYLQADVTCELAACFDRFDRESYSVSVKNGRNYFQLYVNDGTCTYEDYDRGVDVNCVDEYGNVIESWGLTSDNSDYVGKSVGRYIENTLA